MQAGDECYAAYGDYPNIKLCMTYGFVLQGADVPRAIDLYVHVPPSCPHAERKRRLLRAHALTASGHSYDFAG
eukprot:SAG11_NODE_16859_length_535_cov_0.910550_1_plen_72_part_10